MSSSGPGSDQPHLLALLRALRLRAAAPDAAAAGAADVAAALGAAAEASAAALGAAADAAPRPFLPERPALPAAPDPAPAGPVPAGPGAGGAHTDTDAAPPRPDSAGSGTAAESGWAAGTGVTTGSGVAAGTGSAAGSGSPAGSGHPGAAALPAGPGRPARPAPGAPAGSVRPAAGRPGAPPPAAIPSAAPGAPATPPAVPGVPAVPPATPGRTGPAPAPAAPPATVPPRPVALTPAAPVPPGVPAGTGPAAPVPAAAPPPGTTPAPAGPGPRPAVPLGPGPWPAVPLGPGPWPAVPLGPGPWPAHPPLVDPLHPVEPHGRRPAAAALPPVPGVGAAPLRPPAVPATGPATPRPGDASPPPGTFAPRAGHLGPPPGAAHPAPPARPGPPADGMDPADDAAQRALQRLLAASLTAAGGAGAVAARLRAALVQAEPGLLAGVPGNPAAHTDLLARGLTWLVGHLDDPPRLAAGCAELGAALRECHVSPQQPQLIGAALAEAMRAGLGAAWRQGDDTAWRETWQHVYAWLAHGAAAAAYRPVTWLAEVVSHERRRADLAVLRLRPYLPMPVRPGSFARVEVPALPGVWRPYSLAGAPRRDTVVELHVRAKGAGGVSGALVHGTAAGDLLRISRAEGAMGLPPGGRDLLLVAGDTGVVPFKAMLTELAATADPRRAVLFWGARTLAELYDVDDVTAIARACPRATVVPVISEGDPGPYASGLVTDAIAAYGEWSRAEAFLAGPPQMLAATVAALRALGVAGERIHHDDPAS